MKIAELIGYLQSLPEDAVVLEECRGDYRALTPLDIGFVHSGQTDDGRDFTKAVVFRSWKQ